MRITNSLGHRVVESGPLTATHNGQQIRICRMVSDPTHGYLSTASVEFLAWFGPAGSTRESARQVETAVKAVQD